MQAAIEYTLKNVHAKKLQDHELYLNDASLKIKLYQFFVKQANVYQEI
jgi:hypothetical protein